MLKIGIILSILTLSSCANTASTIPTKVIESTPSTDTQTMCTQDAMQCSDGTWVGRTGTHCEFVCPATTTK